MIFDGTDLRDFFHIGFDRSILPSVRVETIDISGRDGAVFQRASLEPLSIPAFFRWKRLQAYDIADRRRLVASLLYREKPCKLILPDEIDKYYMAIIEGSTALDSLSKNSKTYVTFTCPDPVAYGRKVNTTMTTRSKGVVGGTYKTRPIFRCTPATGSYYKITNVKTGEFVQVNASFDGTQALVIDCEQQKTTLNGVNYPVTFTSDYFCFEPGSYEVTANSGSATIEWRERWV